MAANVTVEGWAAPPETVRETAGIRPGDVASPRARQDARQDGGATVEKDEAIERTAILAAHRRIDDALALLDRRGVKFSMTADEWTNLMRGGD